MKDKEVKEVKKPKSLSSDRDLIKKLIGSDDRVVIVVDSCSESVSGAAYGKYLGNGDGERIGKSVFTAKCRHHQSEESAEEFQSFMYDLMDKIGYPFDSYINNTKYDRYAVRVVVEPGRDSEFISEDEKYQVEHILGILKYLKSKNRFTAISKLEKLLAESIATQKHVYSPEYAGRGKLYWFQKAWYTTCHKYRSWKYSIGRRISSRLLNAQMKVNNFLAKVKAYKAATETDIYKDEQTLFRTLGRETQSLIREIGKGPMPILLSHAPHTRTLSRDRYVMVGLPECYKKQGDAVFNLAKFSSGFIFTQQQARREVQDINTELTNLPCKKAPTQALFNIIFFQMHKNGLTSRVSDVLYSGNEEWCNSVSFALSRKDFRKFQELVNKIKVNWIQLKQAIKWARTDFSVEETFDEFMLHRYIFGRLWPARTVYNLHDIVMRWKHGWFYEKKMIYDLEFRLRRDISTSSDKQPSYGALQFLGLKIKKMF